VCFAQLLRSDHHIGMQAFASNLNILTSLIILVLLSPPLVGLVFLARANYFYFRLRSSKAHGLGTFATLQGGHYAAARKRPKYFLLWRTARAAQLAKVEDASGAVTAQILHPAVIYFSHMVFYVLAAWGVSIIYLYQMGFP